MHTQTVQLHSKTCNSCKLTGTFTAAMPKRKLTKCTLHTYCVSKNEPTLARCSFDKHGLILIIFGKQHQRTFKKYMHLQLSVYLHFYLLYLLLNSYDGNDAERVFSFFQ